MTTGAKSAMALGSRSERVCNRHGLNKVRSHHRQRRRNGADGDSKDCSKVDADITCDGGMTFSLERDSSVGDRSLYVGGNFDSSLHMPRCTKSSRSSSSSSSSSSSNNNYNKNSSSISNSDSSNRSRNTFQCNSSSSSSCSSILKSNSNSNSNNLPCRSSSSSSSSSSSNNNYNKNSSSSSNSDSSNRSRSTFQCSSSNSSSSRFKINNNSSSSSSSSSSHRKLLRRRMMPLLLFPSSSPPFQIHALLISFILFLLSAKIHGSNCRNISFKSDILRPDNSLIAEKLKLFQGGLRPVAAQSTSKLSGSELSQANERRSVVSFCPAKCSCNITLTNQLQVICDGHFDRDFPIVALRKDVEVLRIVPRCSGGGDEMSREEGRGDNLSDPDCSGQSVRENKLVLGPDFKYLRLLKILVITDSRIPNLGIRTLWGLSGLRVLNLSRNKLTEVVDKNFDGLYSLKEIYFDENRIRSMESAAFRHLTQLEILSLRKNKLEDLSTRIFFKLRNLKYLDLSGNNLEHIDGSVFQDTPQLETFACDDCGLFQLDLPELPDPGQKILIKLHSLYLSRNTIQRVSDLHPVFLKHLQVLDLSRNKLNSLDRGTLVSPVLKKLDLARNNISHVEECALCGNSLLEKLDLGYNRLAELNASMVAEDMPSLRKFTLSGNWVGLGGLEKLLGRLSRLEQLNLAHTGLVSVPVSLFTNNPLLRQVNLSQNLLVDLEPPVFQKLHKLETLDLSSNFLMGLGAQFFQEVDSKKRIRMVYLQNNQWKCDQCHIRPLLHFLKNSLMYWGSCFQPGSPLCLKCAQPDQLLHVHIEDLKEDQLPDCEPHYQQVHFGAKGPRLTGLGSGGPGSVWERNGPYAIAGLTVLLVVLLVLGFVVRFRHYGAYFTHEDDQLVDNDDELLRNPVIVLDRNNESYINLKYPVLPESVEFSPSNNSSILSSSRS